jgi:6-pyruvoyltetrahydropterin/6-carboxytetrahydropterin synthase
VTSPVVQLGRVWHFCASHRLHVDALSAEENTRIFGKCNHPHGHGHNYTVEVSLRGAIDAATGMVVNLADLDAFAARELIERFDHRNLNTLDCFADRVSTTENLARELWSIFMKFNELFPQVELVRVRVEETANNSFEYFGDNAAQ